MTVAARPGHTCCACSKSLAKDYAFLAGDQARLDRINRDTKAELDAVRRLVVDIIDDVIPGFRVFSDRAHWPAEDWRARAMRVVNGRCLVDQEGRS